MISLQLTWARAGACPTVLAVLPIVGDFICVPPFSGVIAPEDLCLDLLRLRSFGGSLGNCPRRWSGSSHPRRRSASSFRGRYSCAGLLLLSDGIFSDEEGFSFYREDEVHPAAGFTSTCDLECTLD